MDLADLRRYAHDLLDREGLSDWTFRFDHAKRRAGKCLYRNKVISVSRHLMSIYPDDLAKDTVIHEVAHALVGPGKAHSKEWKAEALRLGGSADVRVASSAPSLPPTWLGSCECGARFERMRRPSANRELRCGRCYRAGRPGHIDWEQQP